MGLICVKSLWSEMLHLNGITAQYSVFKLSQFPASCYACWVSAGYEISYSPWSYWIKFGNCRLIKCRSHTQLIDNCVCDLHCYVIYIATLLDNCYCAYFYYVNKLYVHVCVLERAKHSFFALPNPLSCSVMNKICLNQLIDKRKSKSSKWVINSHMHICTHYFHSNQTEGIHSSK